MERRLGNGKPVMVTKPTACILVAAVMAIAATATASAQSFGERPVRYGNTSSFHFDGRNDHRDFPTNGYFPGDFAGDPFYAAIGAAGFLESNPRRSPVPYPSRTYFVPPSR
jgi:hypothetical protein